MKKEKIYKLLTHLVLLAGVICMLLPLFWMLMTSFKNNIEAVAVPMTVFPKVWDFGGYQRVWERNIIRPYINTIIISMGIVICQLVTASMAAYAFARLNFPGEKISVCSYYLYDYDSTAYDFDSKIQNCQCYGTGRYSCRGDSS